MTTLLNALAIYPPLDRVKHSSPDDTVEMVKPNFRREAAARTVTSKLHVKDPLDRAVEDRINVTLDASPYHAVRRVRCRFEKGVLSLHGTVPSYHCVQLAITLVRARIPDHVPLQNCLQVFNTSEA